jgi:hypothetical protein
MLRLDIFIKWELKGELKGEFKRELKGEFKRELKGGELWNGKLFRVPK